LYWRQVCLFPKTLAEKEIIKIQDLISDDNELIVKNNRRVRELNISPLRAFRLLALTDALPLKWREGLKTISYIEDEPFNIHEGIKLNLTEQTSQLQQRLPKLSIRNFEIDPSLHQLLS